MCAWVFAHGFPSAPIDWPWIGADVLSPFHIFFKKILFLCFAGSVAIEIGTQSVVCERLVELSSSIDVGVTSEAQRLIAALIKNSKTDSKFLLLRSALSC